MNSPRKITDPYDRLASMTGVERKSSPKRGCGKRHSSTSHRPESEAHPSELVKGRKGKLNYLSDATPPPELGENLNA